MKFKPTKHQMAINILTARYREKIKLDSSGKPSGAGTRKLYNSYMTLPVSELTKQNEIAVREIGRLISRDYFNPSEPVKGEQPGMLGVPGKVHVQKRPYSIGQEELEDYGKYKRQMLIDYDRQYSLEQLREMCRAKGYSTSGDKKRLIGRLI